MQTCFDFLTVTDYNNVKYSSEDAYFYEQSALEHNDLLMMILTVKNTIKCVTNVTSVYFSNVEYLNTTESFCFD